MTLFVHLFNYQKKTFFKLYQYLLMASKLQVYILLTSTPTSKYVSREIGNHKVIL